MTLSQSTPNTSNPRVLHRVSYSENNRDIYTLTMQNHMRYCAMHNYTYMAVNEPYSMFNDINMLSNLLCTYDIVYTCDSDILFTSPEVPITDFAYNYVNAAMEGWGPEAYSILNGGFLIFYRKDDGVFDYLRKFAEFQDECRAMPEGEWAKMEYKSGRNDIVCTMPAWSTQGTQSTLNLAFIRDRKDVMSGIGVIESGRLQAYLPEYMYIVQQIMYTDSLWNRRKFSLHLLGMSSDLRFRRKADMVADFLQRYPEYK